MSGSSSSWMAARYLIERPTLMVLVPSSAARVGTATSPTPTLATGLRAARILLGGRSRRAGVSVWMLQRLTYAALAHRREPQLPKRRLPIRPRPPRLSVEHKAPSAHITPAREVCLDETTELGFERDDTRDPSLLTPERRAQAVAGRHAPSCPEQAGCAGVQLDEAVQQLRRHRRRPEPAHGFPLGRLFGGLMPPSVRRRTLAIHDDPGSGLHDVPFNFRPARSLRRAADRHVAARPTRESTKTALVQQGVGRATTPTAGARPTSRKQISSFPTAYGRKHDARNLASLRNWRSVVAGGAPRGVKRECRAAFWAQVGSCTRNCEWVALRTTPLGPRAWEGTERATIHEPGDLPPRSPIPRSGVAEGADVRRGDACLGWRRDALA